MIKLDGSLKTDDMSLAAILSMNGYPIKMQLKGDGSKHVYWLLSDDDVDDAAKAIVADYQHGAARVEPVKFTLELRAVRLSLYKFIGHEGVPVDS